MKTEQQIKDKIQDLKDGIKADPCDQPYVETARNIITYLEWVLVSTEVKDYPIGAVGDREEC